MECEVCKKEGKKTVMELDKEIRMNRCPICNTVECIEYRNNGRTDTTQCVSCSEHKDCYK